MTAILQGEGVTPVGIYLLARSYHQAADTVANDHKNALPDPPARLLYLHAAETYLRCFLRTKGVTPQSLRKFNHQLGNMLDEAIARGLRTSVKVTKYLQSAAAENDYVRARYDINVRSRSWPPSKGGRSTALHVLQEVLRDLQTSIEDALLNSTEDALLKMGVALPPKATIR